MVFYGGTEGNQGVENIAFHFGISKGSVSNYKRHVSEPLLKVLHDDQFSCI